MNLNDNEYIIKLLLFIEFVIFFFACLILYEVLPEHSFFVLIVANICSIIYLYTYIKYIQAKKIKKYIKIMTEDLNTLRYDYDENILLLNNNPDILEFHYKVEEIRERYRKKEMNRQKILSIVNSVAVNMEIQMLLEDLMPKLIEVTNSNCGIFYLANNSTNKLELKHSVGFSKNVYSEFDLLLGEGIIGLSAQSREIQIIRDLPEDTVYVMRTFLGKIKPKTMMIVPIVNQEQLLGVFAFASIYDYSEDQLEMVKLIKYYVSSAVGNGLIFEKTKRLTNELKFQNRLIQNLNDDLEKKVQDRTSFLNDIIDSIKDHAIYAVDRDGMVLVWNKGAENLFGYPAKDTIGKHIDNFYPEEEVKAGYVQNRLQGVLRDGKYVEKGWKIKKDGTPYYAEIVFFARHNAKGDIIGFTNVTKDITNLKEAENSLWYERELSSKLIEGSSRALVCTYEDGYIHNFNQKAEEILNSNNIIDMQIYDFFENGDKLQEHMEYIIKTGTRGEWSYKLKNDDVSININASFLLNELDGSKTLFFYLY